MNPDKAVTLEQELKCYGQPDTRSRELGRLPRQRFNVIEERLSCPSEETDYLLLSTPGIGTGQAWICSRWKDHRYASVTESLSDAMAIPESLLVARLKDFRGYGYDMHQNISYPWPLPGVQVPTGLPTPKINCCTFVEALLVKAWEDALPGRFSWSRSLHDQMMILGKKDVFSPVRAVVEAGMATPLADPSAPPPPWTLVQGWKSLNPLKGGHSFLVVAERQGVVLTLEANAAYGLSGVGFRGLGNAEQFGFAPPPDWWCNPDLWMGGKVWTWERLLAAYGVLKLARLKVIDPRWAG
ncbi:hypothetical protein ACN28I_16680 [Archangium gephyra]|uniref:hypothetical protein n=1 Tax=Archangium gephyra TaxID=48 RepID=UPI003B791A65